MRALPLLLPLVLLGAGLAAHGSPEGDLDPGAPSPAVRVKLSSLGGLSRLQVSGAGLAARNGKGEGLPLEGAAVLMAVGSRVKLGDREVDSIRLEADLLKVGQGRAVRDYPDRLAVTASRGRLRVVNETSLERYTEGVLAGECPALFHPEAIRAMAVAARSYSYRKAFLAQGELCDTVHCQVYRGACAVKAPQREAVRATAGTVALFDGEVIDAVYSSDCGGYTEASEAAWRGGKAVPYLRPVEDAPEPQGEPYCAGNRGHHWSLSVPRRRLVSLLGKTAPQVSVRVADFTESGRARQIILEAATEAAPRAAGKCFTGDQWRRVLGLSAVKSLRFEIRETATGVQLEGRGYGHGVGLCQYGAHGMGKTGCTFAEILKHYYTGIELGPVPPTAAARARFKAGRLGKHTKRPDCGGKA